MPIVVALGYIPLIVHEKLYNSRLSQFEWFASNMDYQTDFFLYYKMIALVLVGLCMVVCLAMEWKSLKREQYPPAIIALGVYFAGVVLSALCSKYKYFVFRGTYEVFETVLAVIAYIVICFFTYYHMKTEEDFRFVCRWAGVGIFLVVFIGFLQYCNLDLFRTTFGKMLITNPGSWGELDKLQFTFPERTVYTTLYNTNYLAFYIGMILPVCFLLFLNEQQKKKKALYLLFCAICLIDLAGSNSKTGFLALLVSVAVMAFILIRDKKRYLGYMLGVGVMFLLMLGIYAGRAGGLVNWVTNMVKGVELPDDRRLSKIETTESDVTFYFDGYELHVQYEVLDEESHQIALICTDENGMDIPYSNEADSLVRVLDDREKYADCTLEPVLIDEKVGMVVSLDGCSWVIANCVKEYGCYLYYNSAAKLVQLYEIPKAHIVPDSIISGRGELWNYTFPILKNHAILGSGANTFMMEYPQNNYFLKKYRQSEYLFDVKAHSLYLQQFVENGMPALIAFLAMYILYFVRSCRLYRRITKHDYVSCLGMGILTGTLAYMIAGIANDSNVNTAVLFWVSLGMGLAINRYIEKNPGKYVA